MKKRRRLRFEARMVLTAVAAVVPMLTAALVLLYTSNASSKAVGTVLFFAALSLFIATYLLHERLVYPLRTLTNLISALREEDYTLRPRDLDTDDVLGEVMQELDALRQTIEERKLEAVEATALLRAVLANIDLAIFAFDPEQRLRIVNRAGERLLGRPSARLLGAAAAEIGLGDLLEGPETVDRRFPGGAGRWSVRRSTFREKGLPHRLLFIADISRALREEEAQAWQRIVRVLSHELNNSLAPIQSIAESTARLVARDPLPDDWRTDAASGMRVISSRAEGLTRFMRAYAQLAKLPSPRKTLVALAPLVQRVAALETRLPIAVAPFPPITIEADADQLEQLLINLLRNAVDASLETGGSVRLACHARGPNAVVEVMDEGLGLAATANLFVPFFTTKPAGSGIGLVLSRQIADAHGGTLTLENRTDGRGCVATVTLPMR
ncbi:MAG TPA: ATP-binding protein [Thermoanaerobaculia bacterium]|jgi:nitrogen fixation/metabolism regulation signal transduction histidine kinase|nr:ATP-binding protein [Thermoanaerobaculia bacterium]